MDVQALLERDRCAPINWSAPSSQPQPTPPPRRHCRRCLCQLPSRLLGPVHPHRARATAEALARAQAECEALAEAHAALEERRRREELEAFDAQALFRREVAAQGEALAAAQQQHAAAAQRVAEVEANAAQREAALLTAFAAERQLLHETVAGLQVGAAVGTRLRPGAGVEARAAGAAPKRPIPNGEDVQCMCKANQHAIPLPPLSISTGQAG